MRDLIGKGLLLSVVAMAGGLVQAHHSFAVFFDDNKTIEIKGEVTEFLFTNPHGVISLTVKNAKGQIETWKAETNAPTLLRRRGWTKETLKTGEVVSILGWQARDGSHYMRMSKVTRADGTVLGAAVQGQVAQTKEEQK